MFACLFNLLLFVVVVVGAVHFVVVGADVFGVVVVFVVGVDMFGVGIVGAVVVAIPVKVVVVVRWCGCCGCC